MELGTMIFLRSAVFIACVLPAFSCAVIDGLTGSSGSGDGDGDRCQDAWASQCTGANCDHPHDLGPGPFNLWVETCDRGTYAFDLGCGGQPDDVQTMVATFSIEYPGEHEVCINADSGAQVRIADDGATCTNNPNGNCFSNDECRTLYFYTGTVHVYFAEPYPESCNGFRLDIKSLEVNSEVECLNGEDEDRDGLTDCEDNDCQFSSGQCNDFGLGEVCDGQDQGDFDPAFPSGSVDEFACPCYDTAGCDHLYTGNAPPYICHFFKDGGGVCGPRCDAGSDWCFLLSGVPGEYACGSGGECTFQ